MTMHSFHIYSILFLMYFYVKVLSNIHTVRSSPAEKDLMIWNVVKVLI